MTGFVVVLHPFTMVDVHIIDPKPALLGKPAVAPDDLTTCNIRQRLLSVGFRVFLAEP